MTRPVALVLDHLELLENQESLDVVAELAAQLPAGAQLLLASRARPPLPVAVLRAQGRVVELGVEELAMDHQEARPAGGCRRRLDDAEVNEVVRTEVAGGAVSGRAGPQGGRPSSPCVGRFTGDDRFMADYLWSELLGQLPPERVAFLRRCWSGYVGRCAMRSWTPPDPALSLPGWRSPTCCWSPSTASAAGIATTTCSASCSRRTGPA